MTKQIGDYFIAAIVGITVASLLLFVAERATADAAPVLIEPITDCVEIVEYDINTGTKTTIGCAERN